MRQAFRILNYAIAAEVVIQAAVIAWAVFGTVKYVDDGNTLTKHKIDHGGVTGDTGYAIHAINGMLIIVIGLALLIVAFLAKIPGGVRLATTLFVLILLQALVLPFIASKVPVLGVLHGANALAILAVTIIAAKRASDTQAGTAGAAY